MELSKPVIDYLASRANEESLYQQLVKQKGAATRLEEEIVEVGRNKCVPFVNTGCKRANCVYDLSTVEEQYAEKFDVTEVFRPAASFDCYYCDAKIYFRDFLSCQALLENTDKLFQSPSLNETPNPHLADASEIKTGSQEELKSPLGPRHNERKIKILLNASPSTSAGAPDSARLQLGLRKSQTKSELSKKKIPSVKEFDLVQAKIFREKVSGSEGESLYRGVKQEEYCFADEHQPIPDFRDIKKYLQNCSESPVLHLALLNFWRARLCQDRGLLMNLGIYEAKEASHGSLGCQPLDRFSAEIGLVFDHSSFAKTSVLIFHNKEFFLFEYDASESKLYLVLERSPNSTATQPVTLQKKLDLAKTFIGALDLGVFGGRLKNLALFPLITKQVTPKQGCWIYPHILARYFPELQEPIAELTDWLILKLLLVTVPSKPRQMIPERVFMETIIELEASSGQQKSDTTGADGSRKKIDSFPVSPINRFGDSMKIPHQKIVHEDSLDEEEFRKMFGEEEGRASSHRDPKRVLKNGKELRSNLKEDPKASPAGQPKKSAFKIVRIATETPPQKQADQDDPLPGINSNRKDYELEDLKRLLLFYYSNDKDRFKILSKKCEASHGAGFLAKLGIREIDSAEQKRTSIESKPGRGSLMLSPALGPSGLAQSTFSGSRTTKSQVLPPLRKGSGSTAELPKATNSQHNSPQMPAIHRADHPDKKKHREAFAIDLKNQKTALPQASFDRVARLMEASHLKDIEEDRHELKSSWFLFSLTFFSDLVEDFSSNPLTIRYGKVEHHTATHKLFKFGTIFNSYDSVVVPLCEEIKGVDLFRVIVIENKLQQVIIYDPSSNRYASHSVKFAKAVLDYIKKENKFRTGITLDMQQFSIRDESPVNQASFPPTSSGFVCLYLIEQVFKGKSHPLAFPEQSALERFKFAVQNRLLFDGGKPTSPQLGPNLDR